MKHVSRADGGGFRVDRKISALHRAMVIGISIFYSTVLANLPFYLFKDRENYLFYASEPFAILIRYLGEDGLLGVILNEPIWLLLNLALSSFLEPYTSVRFIVFSSAFLFSYVFLMADKKNIIFLLITLLLPQIFKNFTVQLRQGLAISVFTFGYFMNNRSKNIFIICSALIHSSFLILIPFYCLEDYFKRMRFALDLKIFLIVVSSFLISTTAISIAQILGARQGVRYEGLSSQFGLGIVFWAIILFFALLEGKNFIYKHFLAFSITTFYIVGYFIIPVVARIFESALPLVCIMIVGLTGERKTLALFSFFGYFFYQWFTIFNHSNKMFF